MWDYARRPGNLTDAEWTRLQSVFGPTKFAYVVEYLRKRRNSPLGRGHLFYLQRGYDSGSEQMNMRLTRHNVKLRITAIGEIDHGCRCCRPLAFVRWPLEGSIAGLLETAKQQLDQLPEDQRSVLVQMPVFEHILTNRILELYPERVTANIARIKLGRLFETLLDDENRAADHVLLVERASTLLQKNRQNVRERVEELAKTYRS